MSDWIKEISMLVGIKKYVRPTKLKRKNDLVGGKKNYNPTKFKNEQISREKKKLQSD